MMEWVSVKDRLPESTGYYLVAHEWQGVTIIHFMHTAYDTPVMQWQGDAGAFITNWMHLPEPPITK
jgi:hypothetical protein